ncbi:MAG: DUF1592 domain-containing protein [Acidobacteriota bacterium]|nr:DUF1592 domain-containing protein [Acidobacteriota bacterium]
MRRTSPGKRNPEAWGPHFFSVFSTLCVMTATIGGVAEAAEAIPSTRAFLDRHCVTCHGDRKTEAGLSLVALDADRIGHLRPEIETWEKVARKLRERSMPPPGRPRPENAVYEGVVTPIEAALDRASDARPDPGRPPIHRLNRAEYRNAIRDLLAIDIDERALLPPDESGYGFDNIADVLSISPLLLDRYMVAAEKISRLALGSPELRPTIEKYTMPYTMRQNGRMSEQLPFGSRGGMAVQHHFPLDGEYVIRLALQRAYGNAIRGLGVPHELELRLDRERIAEFTIGGDGERGPWDTVSRPTIYEQVADDEIEVRIRVAAGTRLVGAAFLDTRTLREGIREPRPGVSSLAYAWDRNSPMALDSIEIRGPYGATAHGDTASRAAILTCRPDAVAAQESCAAEILGGLARRAFRRPIGDEDLDPLLALFAKGRERGGFEGGIEFAMRGILIDPEFLFRLERDPTTVAPATAYRLTDLELASRLSFFLWSSIPDDELLALAEADALSNAETLRDQVARMLRDPRSEALIDNFFGQWLLLRNMRSVAPDPDAFLDFDENLREAMQRETRLFVANQVREDRSVTDLVDADYTYLNERLARHYGIAGVYGNHFRRVPLDGRGPRTGLLGQGSVLTVTSYPNRTSPTKRGLWVLEHLLGAPPPPPPPDVPSRADTEATATGQAVSMRERLDLHRTNAVCASCHARMDPLGFALENYDGIGAWRDDQGGAPIDASAVLANGTDFEGPGGLRRLLLGERDRFAATVTEKLTTYALGRGLEYFDAAAIRRIARQAAVQDYRWSAIVEGIVESTPFQMRRSQE